MACLGCGVDQCACDIVAVGLPLMTGTGEEGFPFNIGLSCEQVQDCIAEMLTNVGFTYDDATDTFVTTEGDEGDLLVANGDGTAEWFFCENLVFSFTGSVQTWTVPEGCTSVTITARGAKGGDGGGLSPGAGAAGNGVEVIGTLAVTPGQVFDLYVAGRPLNTVCGRIGAGWPNGGSGGSNSATGCVFQGGGGGGSSSMRLQGSPFADSVIVAAGGGGGSGGDNHAPANDGGDGGWNPGEDGQGFEIAGGGKHGAEGATQSAGGLGGCIGNTSTPEGQDGTFGQGGDGGSGATSDLTEHGGGGGGGWYGGGGAGSGVAATSSNHAGGAGGGSSMTQGLTDVSHSDGVWTGNGEILLDFCSEVFS